MAEDGWEVEGLGAAFDAAVFADEEDGSVFGVVLEVTSDVGWQGVVMLFEIGLHGGWGDDDPDDMTILDV